MKEVLKSGSLASFKIKKVVRFKQDEDILQSNYQTGADEDVKEGNSTAPSHKPKVIRGVKPNVVLVEGVKCRSQLKCKDKPGGYVGLGCSVALGEHTRRNKQIFHTWLFLDAGL